MTKAELHAAATQTSTAAVVTEEVSRLSCIKFRFLSFPLERPAEGRSSPLQGGKGPFDA